MYLLKTGEIIERIEHGVNHVNHRELLTSIWVTLLNLMIFLMGLSRLHFYGHNILISTGSPPPLACYDLNFLLTFKSKRYTDFGVKVLAGSGRNYIVSDQYYKTGQSGH